MSGQTEQRPARTGTESTNGADDADRTGTAAEPEVDAVRPDGPGEPPTRTLDGSADPDGQDGRPGPVPRVPAQARPSDRIPPARDIVVGVVPGTALTDRYVLRQRAGADQGAGAEFWRAEDTVLRRPVAVTVLRRLPADDRSDDPEGAARAGEMVVRALRSGCFEHPGSARLLDVLAPDSAGLPEDVLGAAVAEWVPGRSLTEVVAGGPVRPLRAARMVETLAAAATEAHQQGLVLGCDHPQRIRITPDGRAQLAFLLPRPSVTTGDDVRGLGAILYTLLTRRWPLSVADAARADLASADRTTAGALRSPSSLRPGIPLELDALCTGALGQGDGLSRVHTAAAVHRMLAEILADEDEVALFPPEHDGAPSEPDDVWQEQGRVAQTRQDPRRRRNLMVGLVVLAAAVLVVLGYLGVQLGSLFGESGGAPPVVVGSAPTGQPVAQGPPGGQGPPVAPLPVTNVSVQVYDPSGDGDNADDVDRVTDGNQSTSWRTQQYRQQFPSAKQGVGIMASFVSPQQLTRLTIDSSSPGTVVEVRSAPSESSSLADTVPITTVTLQDGRTTVPLDSVQPTTQHVLLWITKLGDRGSSHVSEIDEVTFDRAAP